MIATGTSAPSLVGNLILIRLLPATRRRPSREEVSKSLEPFFAQRKTTAEWNLLLDETLESLEASGLITRKPLVPTEQGRRQALDFLGLEGLPPRASWRSLKNLLLAMALDLPGNSPENRKHLADVGKLRGEILNRHYDLATTEFPTLSRALNALAWKQLKVDSDKPFTLKAVLALILGLPASKGKEWQAKIPARVVGARNAGAGELRLALLRRWVDGSGPTSATPSPEALARQHPVPAPAGEPDRSFNLAGFAEAVLEAARSSSTGRFGDHKVFIASVWRQFHGRNDFPGMDEATFKERLVEANHAGLLALSRADLVEVMNPQDVHDSETRYRHAAFHFVQV